MKLVLILILAASGEGEVYSRNPGDTLESCQRDGDHIVANDPKYSGYVCLYDSRTQSAIDIEADDHHS